MSICTYIHWRIIDWKSQMHNLENDQLTAHQLYVSTDGAGSQSNTKLLRLFGIAELSVRINSHFHFKLGLQPSQCIET